MQSNETRGKIRLFGCGGTGINIVSTFEKTVGNVEPGYAIAEPVFIDCSRSNIHHDIADERILIMDVREGNKEGSGKKRDENSTMFSRNTRSILQKFEPSDFNVVVFSASGGTGSVIGPLIVNEILNRQETVVCVIVGSDESMVAANNTLGTLKTLENFAAKQEAPVIAYYEHNRRDTKRSQIDYQCRELIGYLSVLASRQNAELDMRDIANWVYYNRTTTAKPRLAFFNVYVNNEDVPNTSDVISVASVYSSPDAPTIEVEPEYHTAGYIRGTVKNFEQAHYVISFDQVPILQKRLEDKIANLKRDLASRVPHDSLIRKDDHADESGLVF